MSARGSRRNRYEITSVSTTHPSCIPTLVAPPAHGGDEIIGRFILRPEVAQQIIEVHNRLHPLLRRQIRQVSLLFCKEGAARNCLWSHALRQPRHRRCFGYLRLTQEASEICQYL